MLTVSGERARVVADGEVLLEVPLSQCSISSRLGNTPRYIRVDGHPGRLETRDSQGTQWLDRRAGSGAYRLLSRLESHSLAALAAGLVVLALAASYVTWGIPLLSRVAAQHLPAGVLERASGETLAVLRSEYLKPSALPAARQRAIRQLLATQAPDLADGQPLFAASDPLGANALALPDGTIIVTDDLVSLASSDIQVLAVIAHEIGHIEHRHAVRQLLQGAAIGVTIALVSGDVSTLGDIVLTLPVVFTQLHYSRDFEREADRYARNFLRQRGLDVSALDVILTRLYRQNAACGDNARTAKDCDEPGWLGYFNTHPQLEQRLQAE